MALKIILALFLALPLAASAEYFTYTNTKFEAACVKLVADGGFQLTATDPKKNCDSSDTGKQNCDTLTNCTAFIFDASDNNNDCYYYAIPLVNISGCVTTQTSRTLYVNATTGYTYNPTAAPTDAPSAAPSSAPSTQPTAAPSAAPSTEPTAAPSTEPTAAPSAAPSTQPTAAPTSAPVIATATPTSAPVIATATPTSAPSTEPTAAPSTEPTAAPSAAPSTQPTAAPSTEPTAAPTATPTSAPVIATATPTSAPVDATATPTSAPVNATGAPVMPPVAATSSPVTDGNNTDACTKAIDEYCTAQGDGASACKEATQWEPDTQPTDLTCADFYCVASGTEYKNACDACGIKCEVNAKVCSDNGSCNGASAGAAVPAVLTLAMGSVLSLLLSK